MENDEGCSAGEFLERAGINLTCLGIMALVIWKAEFVARYWFIAIPAGVLAALAFFLGVAKRSRERMKKDGGRARKKGRFPDVERQSGWITFFAIASSIAGGAVLFYLWHDHLLARYWFLTAPAAVLLVVSCIDIPEPATGYGGEGST